MRAQVIINDSFLKSKYGIYKWSIVNITHIHKRKKDGAVFWYKVTYKGSPEITMRPNELNVINEFQP